MAYIDATTFQASFLNTDNLYELPFVYTCLLHNIDFGSGIKPIQ